MQIYGPGRALFKAAGRLRLWLPTPRPRVGPPDIAIAGCGQFAFATIGYFLQRRFGRRVLGCFDTDTHASASLARGLGVAQQSADFPSLIALPGLRVLYIASNHASHADYAAQALSAGLDVYVEKPVAVTLAQLATLERVRRCTNNRLFAGYNRPFSGAIRDLRRQLQPERSAGVSLQCFVAGHVLPADHWYRRPDEGTRICGNVGHWLDLFIHLIAWRSIPAELKIALNWADDRERDDNLSISISSDHADLCAIMLTARSEPFEGINESIQFQHADVICKIDDFRTMTLWKGDQVTRYRYWPKDPGHRDAIYQPFAQGAGRDWEEVLCSTLLMLHIADMVRRGERQATFDLPKAREALERMIDPR